MIQKTKWIEILEVLNVLGRSESDAPKNLFDEDLLFDFLDEVEVNLYELNKETRKIYLTQLRGSFNVDCGGRDDPNPRNKKCQEAYSALVYSIEEGIQHYIEMFNIGSTSKEESEAKPGRTFREFFKNDYDYDKAITAIGKLKLFREGGKLPYKGKGSILTAIHAAFNENGLLIKGTSREPFIMALAKHCNTTISPSGISQAKLDDVLLEKLLSFIE